MSLTVFQIEQRVRGVGNVAALKLKKLADALMADPPMSPAKVAADLRLTAAHLQRELIEATCDEE